LGRCRGSVELQRLDARSRLSGLAYLYANGVYYRQRGDGSYEIAQAPAAESADGQRMPDRGYVYPRSGQSAQQQARDEYECHRWAVAQTRFDPTGALADHNPGNATLHSNYQRAVWACLEGRDYTVR
jgi:hypothetical protein